jgi:hypothetical protein
VVLMIARGGVDSEVLKFVVYYCVLLVGLFQS